MLWKMGEHCMFDPTRRYIDIYETNTPFAHPDQTIHVPATIAQEIVDATNILMKNRFNMTPEQQEYYKTYMRR